MPSPAWGKQASLRGQRPRRETHLGLGRGSLGGPPWGDKQGPGPRGFFRNPNKLFPNPALTEQPKLARLPSYRAPNLALRFNSCVWKQTKRGHMAEPVQKSRLK